MDRIKVAKELVRIAKSLVADDSYFREKFPVISSIKFSVRGESLNVFCVIDAVNNYFTQELDDLKFELGGITQNQFDSLGITERYQTKVKEIASCIQNAFDSDKYFQKGEVTVSAPIVNTYQIWSRMRDEDVKNLPDIRINFSQSVFETFDDYNAFQNFLAKKCVKKIKDALKAIGFTKFGPVTMDR